MAAELSGWTSFFNQLSSFLISCERQYGLANQQYTEYAVERLSQHCQSVQAILDPIRRTASVELSSLCTCLTVTGTPACHSESVGALFWYSPYPASEKLLSPLGITLRARSAKIPHLPRAIAVSALPIILLDWHCWYVNGQSDDSVSKKSRVWTARWTPSSISDPELIERVRQLLVQHPQVIHFWTTEIAGVQSVKGASPPCSAHLQPPWCCP